MYNIIDVIAVLHFGRSGHFVWEVLVGAKQKVHVRYFRKVWKYLQFLGELLEGVVRNGYCLREI